MLVNKTYTGAYAPVYCFAIIFEFYIYIINVNKETKEFSSQVIAAMEIQSFKFNNFVCCLMKAGVRIVKK